MTLLRITPAIGTHVGMRRRHNEDAVGYRYPDSAEVLQQCGAMFIVADGVGGLSVGERASSMAVERLIKHYYDADSSISAEERLAKAVQRVNEDVYQLLNDPGRPAATTLVTAVIKQNQMIAASVGDSQIFLIRENDISQLNEIDVLADGSEEDGALTKAIGYRETLEVETISGQVQPGDVIVLCSDGLTRYLSNVQLIRLSRLQDPRDSVRRMINEANQKGGADNVSVAVIRVGDALEEADVSKHVQKLVVPVAIDTQPMMTPDVATKPHTNIPQSRPERVVQETLPVAENPVPKAASQPRHPREVSPQDTRRNLVVMIAVAVLIVGAVIFFGALFFLTRGRDTLPATATIESNQTEPISPTEDLSTQMSNDDTIEVGDVVTVDTSFPTLLRVGESVGSFVTVPDTSYLIQEIFEDNEGTLWYRLLDEEAEQTGWISASEITSGE